MADIDWIKLDTDIFDNPKIKFIRTLPNGNDIVLIWIMLLAKAGIVNDGGMIYLTENIPYTSAMLADEFKYDGKIIVEALKALVKLRMISYTDGADLTIVDWEGHQNSERMEEIREQNKVRKQRQREKHKFRNNERDKNVTERDITQGEKVPKSAENKAYCGTPQNSVERDNERDKNVTERDVTKCHATEEEKEKEIDKDTILFREQKNNFSGTPYAEEYRKFMEGRNGQ